MMAAADRAPFDTSSDRYYFPSWTFDSELAEGPDCDSTHRDLQNAWFSFGLAERKPHIERGADDGPARPDEPLTATERWLREMGAECAARIGRSEPTTVRLYRGMTVPGEWLGSVRVAGTLSLPLSSFATDPGTGAFYATQDRPHHHHSVLLGLAPGARTYPILSSEHLTHGVFSLHRVRAMTEQEFSRLIGEPYATRMRATGTPLPTVLSIHQHSLPALPRPATHHRRYWSG
jgi:hypothetical protein